jgi:aminopeptidase-like protein
MIKLIEDLWFKTRNLVSDDYDASLKYISNIIPLKIHEIKSGTKCWTWTVPEKWIIQEAWIEDLDGNRILDLKDHPLHVVSYSLPINKIVTKQELLKHIYTRPDRPKAIPFDFKYYERDWGFCMQHEKLEKIVKEKYKVFIDSKFIEGTLKIGEYTIKGKLDQTIVLVAHLCHPAMVNDDLAGVAVLIEVAKELSKKHNQYSYKILFLPETIGSIAYLSQNEDIISKLKYGIFFEMLGNDNIHALQYTRGGDTRIDRIAKYVMKRKLDKFREGDFRKVIANDEMVFNGPGIDIPMISISRYPYPEYHTSDDNPSIISEERLDESKGLILDIIEILDNDYIPLRQFKGPVFLSGLGLWNSMMFYNMLINL